MALREPVVTSDADGLLDGALSRVVLDAGSSGAALEDLWHTAIAVDPDMASAPDRRHRLRASIDRLVETGVARGLPVRRNAYDRAALPPLPRFVVRAGRAAPVRKPRTVLPADLRPELAAARTLERIRADEVETLEAVNAFLRDWVPERPDVPVRERSLEIFGDEKRIDALEGTRLFTTGVLSHGLLHCYEVHPPFVFERVSDAAVALVVENHHTYESARRALAAKDLGIGVVAYGAGRAFCASVTYLADLDPAVKQAFYFGDLDAAGLSIAIAAAEAAQRAGGAPLEPAAGLYRALLASGRRRTGGNVAEARAWELVSWLPADLQAGTAAVLAAGLWIPQEAVGLEILAGLDDWLG